MFWDMNYWRKSWIIRSSPNIRHVSVTEENEDMITDTIGDFIHLFFVMVVELQIFVRPIVLDVRNFQKENSSESPHSRQIQHINFKSNNLNSN